MNAADIARAVFSRGTTTNGEQIVCVDGLTIEDVYVLCRAVLDAEDGAVAWLVVDAKGKRFTIYNQRLADAIKQVSEQIGSTLKVVAVCVMPHDEQEKQA